MRPDLTSTISKVRVQFNKARKLIAAWLISPPLLKLKNSIKHYSLKSLANRILALQFAWAIVVYVLFMGALWLAINLVIESNVRHQGEGWISKLDELGIPVYASNDPSQLGDTISYVHNFPEVLQAQYLDATGKKISASYTRKGVTLSPFLPLNEHDIAQLKSVASSQRNLRFEKGDNSQMRISAPIWVKSISNDGMIDFSLKKKSTEKIMTIGFIDLVLDYSHTSKELNRNLTYASLIIAALMIVAAFIGRILVHWALQPLANLEEPLTRLANGETDVTVCSTGDREIARIGIALNTTIGALKQRDEAMRRMANHDGLTDLVNRKYFVAQLEKEIERIAAEGGSSALFFFDIDRFKFINDTYGHAAGDRLLIQIAQQLSRATRDTDLVSRFGGDEFTLLAYNANMNGAQEIAESFMQHMREFVFYEAGEMLKIHFSIGITLINDGQLTSHDYLREADTAVHEAKAQGRNCYRMYSRINPRAPQKTADGWHERLQAALSSREILAYYQPVVGLKNQSENIHEVFLRLPDAERDILLPGAFMPAAERFGLMAEFDRKMIEKIAGILKSLNDSKLCFSLNLCAQFICDKNITAYLKQAVIEQNISPRHFIFELQEQDVIRNLDILKITIPVLSDMGFRFAIDDFGAGFCSYNYIKQLPVHFLKISNELIENINGDSIDRIAVSSIVEIASNLNMQTVAKFATDEASNKLLGTLGIDYVQGNLSGKPAPQFKA